MTRHGMIWHGSCLLKMNPSNALKFPLDDLVVDDHFQLPARYLRQRQRAHRRGSSREDHLLLFSFAFAFVAVVHGSVGHDGSVSQISGHLGDAITTVVVSVFSGGCLLTLAIGGGAARLGGAGAGELEGGNRGPDRSQVSLGVSI
ncbi:hypothetical protein B0T26DRAFT_731994 [Lasiosphaeria miniovina]|uniref:Uncharacterized protein n=1 Tax=Lasiosphaeria miniovina TaxID=1954250 RepID=A0AA40DJF6_9PEZI|nr:uncharacterized protein B0T26DRAFT_731994 [Lasiosphaeria miniovina]KAK0703596.1 hypothetical protein B0T26DRAFT_731994 [Lasiosphaeria miniovina]